MSDPAGRPSRSGLLLPTLFALLVVAVLTGLGVWQLQRKAWKEALINVLEQRLSMPPAPLPGGALWAGLDPSRDEYLRVSFSATLLAAAPALVYAAASAFRPDVSGSGYWVLAPVRTRGGDIVVLNRGFVPEGRQKAAMADAEPANVQEMVGVLRWPEPRNLFTPADDPGRNLWFARDPVAIAAAKGWGTVAPFYVELESPQPAGGLPRAGRLRPTLRNEHLQYAVTWFGLALAGAGLFGVWLVQYFRNVRR